MSLLIIARYTISDLSSEGKRVRARKRGVPAQDTVALFGLPLSLPPRCLVFSSLPQLFLPNFFQLPLSFFRLQHFLKGKISVRECLNFDWCIKKKNLKGGAGVPSSSEVDEVWW